MKYILHKYKLGIPSPHHSFLIYSAHIGLFLVIDPTSIIHLQHGISLFRYGGIVGDDDNGAAIVIGKATEDLYDVVGIGRI